MIPSSWPLFHIVSDQSRRNLLAARGPGDVPELAEGGAGTGWGWERPREVDKIMRMPPVGKSRERRTA